MEINRINNVNFGARIQVQKLQKYVYLTNELQKTAPPSSQLSTGANYLSSCVSSAAGVSAGKTTASGSGVIGTAFIAKASGINMSGIAPSVMAKVASSAPVEVVATSVEKPEVAGSLFTTIGAFINRHLIIRPNNTRNFPT